MKVFARFYQLSFSLLLISFIALLFLGFTFLKNQKNLPQLRSGDIIFQISKSSQSRAIQLATNSVYSHMGIIFESKGKLYVYEAGEKVRLTPFNNFVSKGVNSHYVVKRLSDAGNLLTPEMLLKLKEIGESYLNRPYDRYFGWGDDKLYCSELVWKMYKNSMNIEIGTLQKFSEFDTSSIEVKKLIRDRYGKKIPVNEFAISPASMYKSNLLNTVVEK